MKFAISKNQLSEALGIVSRAVSQKNPRAILTGIKFELNQHGLFLTGSDSDISIVTKIPLQENDNTYITVFDPGVIVVSAKFITDITRKLEGDTINFETVEENIVKIKDHVSDFSLNCMESKDYPVLDLNFSGNTLNIPTATLAQIITQTSYAASDKETRPILTGVNFKCSGKLLECVATDSYRLSKKVVKIDDENVFNVTMPARTLNEVVKIAEGETNVEICITDKKVNFRFQNTLVSTRVINGVYPDTSKLIPPSFEYKLATAAQGLIASIDRASLLSVDRNNIVKLSMNYDNVEISSRSQEIGSAVEKVPNFHYEGNRLDISFTSKYVIDAIKALGSEEIVLSFNGDAKPFVISNSKDDTCIQLVLPVRTY